MTEYTVTFDSVSTLATRNTHDVVDAIKTIMFYSEFAEKFRETGTLQIRIDGEVTHSIEYVAGEVVKEGEPA